MWKEYIKGKEEKNKWDAHGPVTLLAHVFEVLRWEMNEDLVITREKGGKLLFHEGEDGLFDHILREDMRKAVHRRSHNFSNKKQCSRRSSQR